MNSSLLLSIVTFGYLLSAIFYLSGVVFQRKPLLAAGSVCGLATLLLQTAALGRRWMESYALGYGHAPFANLYESLVFGAWAITCIYLVLERRLKQRSLGFFPLLIAFMAMAYASFSPEVDSKIQPLVPALKSNWLIAHVVTCFLGYAAFAVSCGISITYLLRDSKLSNPNPRGFMAMIPEPRRLDELNHQMVLFGFLWLSVGIITGSVWANSAWGTYWSWDPKETWSLITWLVYAALLHSRSLKGWRGRRVAKLSILGFTCVLFTYFGVNFLLSGLHSYGAK